MDGALHKNSVPKEQNIPPPQDIASALMETDPTPGPSHQLPAQQPHETPISTKHDEYDLATISRVVRQEFQVYLLSLNMLKCILPADAYIA